MTTLLLTIKVCYPIPYETTVKYALKKGTPLFTTWSEPVPTKLKKQTHTDINLYTAPVILVNVTMRPPHFKSSGLRGEWLHW